MKKILASLFLSILLNSCSSSDCGYLSKAACRELRNETFGNLLLPLTVGLLILIVVVLRLIKSSNQKELEEWNKNNKKKFETYRDLKEHLLIKKLNAKEDERIKEKKAREKIVKPKKESFTKNIFSRRDSLTANIARLNKLSKNGTLTKAEFEKAKNNLLK